MLRGPELDAQLDGRPERVRRLSGRLTAPLLITRYGAKVRHLHHDAVERARERGRVGVGTPGEREAPSARISCSRAGGRTEG